MAKKKNKGYTSYYSGPNQALIKGAGAVYATENRPVNLDFSKQFENISQGITSARTKQQNALEAAEKEANEAYSVLENLNFEGILPGLHMGAKEILMPLSQQIAQSRLNANAASNRDQKNEFSVNANMQEGVLKNVVSQLKDLSENAKEQLDFNRSQDKSAANDPGYISAINKIFSGQAQPQIIDNELGFVIDGETYKYSQLKNLSPKATQEYTSYSDSLKNAVKAQDQLKQPEIDSYRTKVTGMISPDNIVSLGMDDFGLGKGILGDQFQTIQDWQTFVDKDYQGAKKLLSNRLTENYIDIYNNSAAEYKRKNPPSGDGKGDQQFTGWANYGGVPTDVRSGLNVTDIDALAAAIVSGNYEGQEFEMRGPNDTAPRKYTLAPAPIPGGFAFVPMGVKATKSNSFTIQDAANYIPGLADAMAQQSGAGIKFNGQ